MPKRAAVQAEDGYTPVVREAVVPDEHAEPEPVKEAKYVPIVREEEPAVEEPTPTPAAPAENEESA